MCIGSSFYFIHLGLGPKASTAICPSNRAKGSSSAMPTEKLNEITGEERAQFAAWLPAPDQQTH
jgi:uncharacterized membrane protein